MKKALKHISIFLSLMLIVSTVLIVPIYASTTVATGKNLLTNPQYQYTVSDDTYSVTGWSKEKGLAVEEGSDGNNIATITVTDTNTYSHFGTNDSLVLDTDKYYKFSVQVKMESYIKSDGTEDFECLSWGNVRLVYQYNNVEVYVSEKITAKTNGWKELSFIIYGGDSDLANKAWSDGRKFAVKSQGIRAKISIRCPSVTVYEANIVENINRIESKNLLSNGSFSSYTYDEASEAFPTTNVFTGFSVASKGTYCKNQVPVQVELNGSTVTAARLTYDGTSYGPIDAFFDCTSSISSGKLYNVSVWIKLTESSYDDTFSVGTGGYVKFGTDRSNGTVVKRSDSINTQGDWQQIKLTVSGTDWASWKSRVGLWIYKMNCDIYLADMRVEEFVGEVSCENEEELITNGGFESYDADTVTFSGWRHTYTGSSNSDKHYIEKAIGRTGDNAVCMVSGDDTRNTNIYSTVSIDPTKDYILTAYIKTDNYGSTDWRCPSWGSIHLSVATNYKILTMAEVSGQRIDYETDWIKLSLLISGEDVPDYTTTVKVIVNANQMRGLVYVDDVSLTLYNGGTVTANRTNAAAGDIVTVTTASSLDMVVDTLTYTYTDRSSNEVTVDITDKMEAVYTECSGSSEDGVTYTGRIYSIIPSDEQSIYQFTMPVGSDVTVSVKFVESALADSSASVDTDDGNHYRMDRLMDKIPATLETSVYIPSIINTAAGTIFSNYSGETAGTYRFYVAEGGKPSILLVTDDGTKITHTFNTDIRNGNWVHLALICDAENNTISLYVDGALFETASVSEFDLFAPCARFSVGNNSTVTTAAYFKGYIRGLTLYSSIRSKEEIVSDMKAVSTEDTALVADFSFLNGYDTNITDRSTNGYVLQNLGWLKETNALEDYAYSFAVIGDTQIVNEGFPDNLSVIYDWILENREAHNIQFMMGLGDITNSDTAAEYVRARTAIQKLDGIIPYSIIRGNHDYAAEFNTYFGLNSTFANQVDGYYGSDLQNTYKVFTVADTDYMIITLDYDPTAAEVAWADTLIAGHPNHNVILTTHRYLNTDSSTDYGLWENLISKHENIVLVLSGHYSYSGILVKESIGENGNTVTQMLIDPQGLDSKGSVGATGMIAMFYFSEDGKDIQVRFYSPIQDKYYNTDAQFSLSLDTVEYRYGDANDDAQINIRDLVRVQKALSDETTIYNKRTANVDRNSIVDINDILALRQQILG